MMKEEVNWVTKFNGFNNGRDASDGVGGRRIPNLGLMPIAVRKYESVTFGKFVKEKRTQKEITLRDFCKRAMIDPSNWSKIEREVNNPPKSLEILNRIADVLSMDDITKRSMIDLAAIALIPDELKPDEYILSKLPIFFKTIRGDRASREDLESLIRTLKNSVLKD